MANPETKIIGGVEIMLAALLTLQHNDEVIQSFDMIFGFSMAELPRYNLSSFCMLYEGRFRAIKNAAYGNIENLLNALMILKKHGVIARRVFI